MEDTKNSLTTAVDDEFDQEVIDVRYMNDKDVLVVENFDNKQIVSVVEKEITIKKDNNKTIVIVGNNDLLKDSIF